MPEIPHLIKMLQDENHNNRFEACEELRVSTPPLPQEAIDALITATKDTDPDVVDAARRALALHTSNPDWTTSLHTDSLHTENPSIDKIFKTFTSINIFLLFTVGACVGAIGLIGMGTGDEGGQEASKPGTIFPVLYLITIIASNYLHKNKSTLFAVIIYIIPILYFIYLFSVPGFFIPY
ncbi:MAG TPA: HEAT repeat domain-containing protein [Anaerolineales bacterium]|jgi:hypothetical protein|nr:hypothetical protein [Anaerolineae bacterium]HRJ56628.1 HEAT repeat domain-containing protein [Anaerolineales bacterium]HRK87634.1 HEAT repeat domain-containing protein [Anaerolineales bacterium]